MTEVLHNDQLKPGEEVLLRNAARRSKLNPFWSDGWRVVKTNGLLVTIERPGLVNSRRVVNVNRLKSAESRFRDLQGDAHEADVHSGEFFMSLWMFRMLLLVVLAQPLLAVIPCVCEDLRIDMCVKFGLCDCFFCGREGCWMLMSNSLFFSFIFP